MKLCKDCKHWQDHAQAQDNHLLSKCKLRLSVSPVTGTEAHDELDIYRFCHINRSSFRSPCGPEARQWEAA